MTRTVCSCDLSSKCRQTATTSCRTCRLPFCVPCLVEHHVCVTEPVFVADDEAVLEPEPERELVPA